MFKLFDYLQQDHFLVKVAITKIKIKVLNNNYSVPCRLAWKMINRTSGRTHHYVGEATQGRKTFRRWHPEGRSGSIHREPSREVPELGFGYVSRVSVPSVREEIASSGV